MISGNYDFKVEAGFTAESVREIYEGGVPSSITLDSWMSTRWRPLHEQFEGKFHPADWYSHCPNTSIAYLRAFGPTLPEAGKIVARTIIYHDADGTPIEYGPMYAGEGMFNMILSGLLRDKGIEHAGHGSRWTVTTPFSVQGFKNPGGKHEHQWLCPFPFLDVMVGPRFNVSNEGVFTFGMRDDLVDMGLAKCYPAQSNGPSHFGILTNSMTRGLPDDNEWTAALRNQ